MLRPFRVGGHQPVLDAVVDHLHEVARACRAAVQIAVLGRRGLAGGAVRAGRGLDARRDRAEDRVEPLDRLPLAADHQAEASLEPEHAAARADVHVMDALLLEPLRALDVVAVVGVATVDDDVVGFHQRGQVFDHLPGDRRRHHHPRGPRLREFRDELLERSRTDRPFALQLGYRSRSPVVDDALVPVAHQAPHEVRAHAPEADHADLHRVSISIDAGGRRQR